MFKFLSYNEHQFIILKINNYLESERLVGKKNIQIKIQNYINKETL